MAQKILVFPQGGERRVCLLHGGCAGRLLSALRSLSPPDLHGRDGQERRASDKYPPEPAKPGQVARKDYSYEKEGSANLFIAYEPLAGKRFLKVTLQRTKKDRALFMQEILQEHYSEVAKAVVVMDNLNTHTPASFYEVSPPEQAKALADRLEIHYTPKHASWLNIAEIELSVLARQGLAHNIATIEDLCRQAQQWQEKRNQRIGTVNWQFRTADARIKLKRLYPVTS